jgi:hypothetical protein
MVRGTAYLWRLNGRSRIMGEAPRAIHMTVQLDSERAGRVAQAFLVSKNASEPDPDEGGWHRASVVPQDVEILIQAFLDAGWDPAERGSAFVLHRQVDLGMYEARP